MLLVTVSRCHGEVPVTFAPHHSEWEGCGEGDGRGPTGGGGGEGPGVDEGDPAG